MHVIVEQLVGDELWQLDVSLDLDGYPDGVEIVDYEGGRHPLPADVKRAIDWQELAFDCREELRRRR